jgi:hypothetical protein
MNKNQIDVTTHIGAERLFNLKQRESGRDAVIGNAVQSPVNSTPHEWPEFLDISYHWQSTVIFYNMFRSTHHTYYKGIGSNINPTNQPQQETHVGKHVEIPSQFSPEELRVLAEGKKAVGGGLSRHLQTSIVVETTLVKVSGNNRT